MLCIEGLHDAAVKQDRKPNTSSGLETMPRSRDRLAQHVWWRCQLYSKRRESCYELVRHWRSGASLSGPWRLTPRELCTDPRIVQFDRDERLPTYAIRRPQGDGAVRRLERHIVVILAPWPASNRPISKRILDDRARKETLIAGQKRASKWRPMSSNRAESIIVSIFGSGPAFVGPVLFYVLIIPTLIARR